MGRHDGKVAVVSGAARGLGREICRRLAEEGADLICLDIAAQVETVPYPTATGADLERTLELVEETGASGLALQVDVRRQDQLNDAIATALERFGRIDIVCPNAGILSHGTGWELDEDEWVQMIDIALNGAWRTARAAIPAMIDADRGGSIVFTSSAMGLKPAYGLSHYVAAKHGVVGLARTLAVELGPHSIRVNTVNPGVTDTPLTFNEPTARAFVPDLADPGRDDLAELYAGLNLLPISTLQPIDIANAVVWLTSDEARYVTGVALPVDAGGLWK